MRSMLLVLFCSMLLCANFSFAASDTDVLRGAMSGSGQSSTQSFLQPDAGRGAGSSLSGNEQRKTLSSTDSLQDLSLTSLVDENTGKTQSRKPSLTVLTEPGDGLVKLSWNLLNLPPQINAQSVRFVVIHGVESGKMTSSHQTGKNQVFTMRELKNNLPYFIQVIAVDQDQNPICKSEEITVTPRPYEFLGSKLEKIFSQKTITMQDKVESDLFQRDLKQFGYDFFRNSSQLSQAIDSLPSSDEYLVGPGDMMKLTLWGAITANLELLVDRNGEIQIPKIGAVKVWGMPFVDVKKAIGNAINRFYRNFEMNLSLGKLRTIQVYVVGEVEAPGSYPVSSMSTVINALSAAGGPSKNGSLRSIRVTRGNRTLDTVDLYDMLLTGDRSKDLRLQNGDTIFVPVIGSVVAVAGEVRRPAIYELNGTTSLQQMLKMAGGVTASGDTGRIQLERLAGNRERTVQDIVSTPESFDTTVSRVVLRDRDMIKIFAVPSAARQVVSLRGSVLRPGEYQYTKNMRLKEIIPSTAVLLPETYLESVEITRISQPDYRKELLTVNLRSALAGNEQDNILLQEQDSIKVFSRWEMVEKPKVAVNGAVVNPGVYDFYPGMSVRDLVTAGGSLKRYAYREQAELSRVVVSGDKAESRRMALNLEKALAGDPEHNIVLQVDDVLIVRSVADWEESTDKFVTLKGEVRFPGVYTVARGEKMSSVIARAGGYTEKAYLFGAKFTRKAVREQQQLRMDEVLQRTERDITQKQLALTSTAASKEELEATRVTLEGMLQGLEKLRKLKAEGRVVMRLSKLEELKKSSFDLEMEGGDMLEIPQRPGVIHVFGQVYNPTSFVYLSEASGVSEYLRKAGGSTKDGEESELYVIRADGSVMSRQQSSFGIQWSDESKSWNFGGFMSKTLMPGDTVVVPQKIERTAWMRDIKDLTQILANVAMTAGSVFLWFK